MTHVEIVCYGSPDQHEKLVRYINNMHYTHKGELREGTVRPYLSEVKLYDIRIPEEHVAQFVKDMRAITAEHGGGEVETAMGLGLWRKFMWFVRKLTPLKAVHPAEKNLHTFPADGRTWFYTICLGKIKDTHQKDIFKGTMKEVL